MGTRSLVKKAGVARQKAQGSLDYNEYRNENNLYYAFFDANGSMHNSYSGEKNWQNEIADAGNYDRKSAHVKVSSAKRSLDNHNHSLFTATQMKKAGVFSDKDVESYLYMSSNMSNRERKGPSNGGVFRKEWDRLTKKISSVPSKQYRDIKVSDEDLSSTINAQSDKLQSKYTLANKYKGVSIPQLDFVLSSSKSIDDKLQEKFQKTLGDDWANTDKFKDWMKSDKGQKFLGIGDTNLVQSILGDKKYNDTMKDVLEADRAGNLDLKNTTDVGKGKWEANKQKEGGFNMFDVFSGKNIGETLLNIGEFAVDTAVDLATASVDWVVDVAEGIDDIIDGENVLDTLVDTTLKVTGLDLVEDIIDDVSEGDYVGAALNGVELSAELNSMPGMDLNPAADMTSVMADNIDDLTSTGQLGDIRDTINDIPGAALDALVGDIDEGGIPSGDINMSSIDKTTMEELRELLGILPGGADSEVIDALVGSDARKLADNQDISSVLQQQRQVSEQGYDVGEREALSGKARRELAGMARKQGQAAGAAAGGLRGASVAAQSRALSEKAMQKQADVTTEMDKSSIARKDTARTNLANLAKDVTKFDVEKEQEKKKRKGATTIGVQSLLQAEETNKQMMDLANQ